MDFWKTVEYQRNEYGNAIVIPVFDCSMSGGGKVKALYPIDFEKVKIWVDDASLMGKKNAIIYVVTLKDGTERKFSSDEVLHFKANTNNGLIGLPIKTLLKETIENSQSAQSYVSNYFKSGLFAKGVLQYTGNVKEESETKMQQKFERMVSGTKNAGKLLPLPLGFSFQPISTNMADAQFFEITNLTIRQIAAAFGVKLHQINDLSKSTHTNISQQQKDFYVGTLQAILTGYEQELTYKLLLDKEIEAGYYFRFNVDAILRTDIKTRYEAHRIAIQNGFMTPNEVRDYEEYPPLEGGDDLICNGNMQKVIDIGALYKNKKEAKSE